MRRYLWLAISSLCISTVLHAQDSTITTQKKKDWSKVNLTNRANDHFMIQFGYDGWSGAPDTLNIKGLSRHFNFYVMYDLPFKTAPRLSFAGGIGVSTSNIFFKDTYIDIANKGGTNTLTFTDVSGQERFKKYKLSNNWLEVPLELRFISDPLHSGKSFKIAIGAKVGTLLDAHTKGKNLVDESGNSLYGTKYIDKEKSKKFFNTTRLSATARIGFGPVTLFGAYQVNSLFKDGQAPLVHPYSIGLCLSGL